MSYEKAMKHSRIIQMLEVNRWHKARHIGDAQYNRECIVESIQTLRDMRKAKTSGN